jgi:hypothetical protein
MIERVASVGFVATRQCGASLCRLVQVIRSDPHLWNYHSEVDDQGEEEDK